MYWRGNILTFSHCQGKEQCSNIDACVTIHLKSISQALKGKATLIF